MENMNDERMLKEPVRFEQSGRVFVYDFTKVSAEQAELARALAQFKEQQNSQYADSFTQIVKSQGTDILFLMMAFLVNEIKNGEIVAFNRDKAFMDIEKIFKSMPASEIKRMEKCVLDFFTDMENPTLGLTIFQSEKKQNATEILYQTLGKMVIGNWTSKKES